MESEKRSTRRPWSGRGGKKGKTEEEEVSTAKDVIIPLNSKDKGYFKVSFGGKEAMHINIPNKADEGDTLQIDSNGTIVKHIPAQPLVRKLLSKAAGKFNTYAGLNLSTPEVLMRGLTIDEKRDLWSDGDSDGGDVDDGDCEEIIEVNNPDFPFEGCHVINVYGEFIQGEGIVKSVIMKRSRRRLRVEGTKDGKPFSDELGISQVAFKLEINNPKGYILHYKLQKNLSSNQFCHFQFVEDVKEVVWDNSWVDTTACFTGYNLALSQFSGAPKHKRGNYVRVYLGVHAKENKEKVVNEANDWIRDERPRWHELFVREHGTKPTYQELIEKMEEEGLVLIQCREKGEFHDREGQQISMEELISRHVETRQDPFDPNSNEMSHVLDDVSSGVAKCPNFDRVSKLDKVPFLKHMANHVANDVPPLAPPAPSGLPIADGNNPHGNEHLVFNRQDFETRLTNEDPTETVDPNINPPPQNRLDECRALYEDRIKSISSLGCNNLEDYFDECEKKKYCLQGALHLETHYNDNGGTNYLDFAPHLAATDPDRLHPRCYVQTRAARAMIDHRTKASKYLSYGHGRPYGKRARLYLIEGRFAAIFDRVGVSHNNTPELASTLLPVPIHTIYEIEWNGPGIQNATFLKVYENYQWIP